jgi:hypothetical protein
MATDWRLQVMWEILLWGLFMFYVAVAILFLVWGVSWLAQGVLWLLDRFQRGGGR